MSKLCSLFIASPRDWVRLGSLSLIILLLQGCETTPEVRVQPTNPPSFTFSNGTDVSMLLVYHLGPEQMEKGIFLDDLLQNKANLTWELEGIHNQKLPITYGIVPVGMKETVPVRPLIEGEHYLVFVASLVSARFVVRNGSAEQIK